jgi:hypothetical protein
MYGNVVLVFVVPSVRRDEWIVTPVDDGVMDDQCRLAVLGIRRSLGRGLIVGDTVRTSIMIVGCQAGEWWKKWKRHENHSRAPGWSFLHRGSVHVLD